MSAFDAYVPARFHGGTMAGGPTFTVIHDAETPLTVGYCDSIVEFFRKGPAAGTSAHAMVDPSKAVKMLPDDVVAYAAGPVANTWGWHLEQAGYASFTRDQWLTSEGVAQLARVGACLREVHDTWGIPKRWMTDDQLRAAAKGDRASGGMTTHQQISRVLGGTTHTDPETNYPRDLLEQAVNGTIEEDFMATMSDAEKARLLDFIDRAPIYIWNDQNANPLILERNGGKPRDARSVQGDIYVHTVALLQQVAGLTAAVNTLAAGAAGAGTTAEELRTVIREEMAKAIDVQVTVNGAPTSPTVEVAP